MRRIYAIRLRSCGKLWSADLGVWSGDIRYALFFDSRRAVALTRRSLRMWPVRSMEIVTFSEESAR